MDDQVALVSTIVTWVAVFLAVLALAGFLPAYLLIRASRQAKNWVIAAIDDPSAVFVKGFRLQLLRGPRKVKIPDLRAAPTFDAGQVPQLRGNTLRAQPELQAKISSSTGYIDLAHLFVGTFTNLEFTDGLQALEFTETQSYLPTHRAWLLSLALKHRYAFREDFSLPVRSSADPELLRFDPKFVLSGLSEVMGTDTEQRGGEQLANRIRFRPHSVYHLRTSHGQKDIPLSSLCFLFAGLLLMDVVHCWE
jgi:hypothetical protein